MGNVPQQLKYITIKVLHKIRNRTEFGNYKGISVVAHAGKILLALATHCLSDFCERMGTLTEEQSVFRPNHSNTDMMFVIPQLQELARKKWIPLYAHFLGLTNAYESIDRTLVWNVLARFVVMQKPVSSIH